MRHHNEPRPRAFTLVELLVVIGIIALLIGILLPSLAAARAQAKAVACMSNVRQIAVAHQMYAQDVKFCVGFVPATGPSPARDRKELLYPYLAQGKNNADNDGNQAWRCPANDQPDVEASYGFSTYLNGVPAPAPPYPVVPPGLRITKVKNWSEKVALADAGLKEDGGPSLATHLWPPGRPGNATSCRPNHLRHPKQQVSVGFLDGHAELVPLKPPFYPGPLTTNPAPATWDLNLASPTFLDRMWHPSWQ